MFTMSEYYVALDAAKNAQAQGIIHVVQGLTARMVMRLHRKRDGSEGHVALVVANSAAVPSSVSQLPAACPKASDTGAQPVSGGYRDSSSCLSSP